MSIIEKSISILFSFFVTDYQIRLTLLDNLLNVDLTGSTSKTFAITLRKVKSKKNGAKVNIAKRLAPC